MTEGGLQGARVLVTGASSGIGSALAGELAGRGAALALAARQEKRLRAVASQIALDGTPEPAVLPVDLSLPGSGAELAERALAALGAVDILVNNAGASLLGLVWAVGDGPEARALYEVNLWNPLALVARLAPPMRDRGHGTIVNVTSMMQVSPFPRMGHYAASKAALGLVTQVLRTELRRTGVRVIEVPLGVVDTPGSFEHRTAPGVEQWQTSGPVGTAGEAARRIADSIEAGRERVIYPRRIAIGYSLPFLARAFAARHARGADFDDEGIRRTGSSGDPEQRAARDAWEQRSGSAA
jgi:short-subunit dehydrogenase